ncbi:hypothetical protein ACSLBF_15145 [Pseudoalteromonas sp. T1lg65]|uniref:hypothetical protein n=1 Tax=Pseudoalteromonas sp. T1lg65 TaxID=2077101 RepID=UPI003F7A6671
MSDKNVPKWQRTLLCKLVSYYKNNQNYSFVFRDNKWCLQPSDKAKLIQVVAKTAYKEQVEKLPITDQKALQSLLKLRKQKNPLARFISLSRYKDDSSVMLNNWEFDAEVPDAPILIPETALLANAASDQELILVNDEYFLAKRNNIIYSTAKYGLVNSPERFANTVGVGFNSTTSLQSEHDLLSRIAHALISTLLTTSIAFYQPKAWRAYGDKIKKAALFTSLSCAAYLALSSAYLVIKKEFLQTQLAENQTQINEALLAFSGFETGKQRVENWQSIFNNTPKLSPSLLVLEKLRYQATIERINYKGDRFVIRGKSKNSIQVLESLNQFDWIVDPKFDFPVRTYQGLEEFVISYDTQKDAYKETINLASVEPNMREESND